MAHCRKPGKTKVRQSHENKGNHNRAFEANARIGDATKENADQISPKADADVVNGNLIIGVAKIIKQ